MNGHFSTNTTPINHSATPIVTLKDNQAFANSRDVAEFFGKEHKHVLRDIENIGPDLVQSHSVELFRENFRPDSYGRYQKTYDMTKDGFTLLVMGYTGKKAMQFKLRYIEEFNRMETQLKEQANAPAFTLPTSPTKGVPRLGHTKNGTGSHEPVPLLFIGG